MPVGFVLIVEQLDRLSRAEPIVAQTRLAAIVMAGIRVITAADNREYSRETLKKEPFGLITSPITMVRAWEESESKS